MPVSRTATSVPPFLGLTRSWPCGHWVRPAGRHGILHQVRDDLLDLDTVCVQQRRLRRQACRSGLSVWIMTGDPGLQPSPGSGRWEMCLPLNVGRHRLSDSATSDSPSLHSPGRNLHRRRRRVRGLGRALPTRHQGTSPPESFTHGSMANALPQAIGRPCAPPAR